MKKILSFLLALVLVLSLCACGGNAKGTNSVEKEPTNGASDAKVEKTIVIQTYTDNGSLDPYVMNTNAYPMTNTIFEPLWFEKQDLQRMALATSVEDGEDPMNHIIHLREGVTFSNGSAFNADDVLFSLKTYSESSSGTYFKNLIDFDKTKATDDYTISIWFNNFDPVWKEMFTSALIVDKETYNPATSAENPIGTGAYKLVSYVVGASAELVYNETWWGGDVDIHRIIVKEMDEDTQVTTALETGELDIAYLAPQADLWYLDETEQFNTFIETISKSNLMLFDQTEGPFTSKEAREAVCWAVDNASIISVAFNGLGSDPKSLFSTMDPIYKDYHTAIHPIYSKNTAQLEKAQEMVKASGLDQESIVIAVQSTEAYKSEAQIIQANLLAAGVKSVEILAIDNSSFYTALGDSSLWDIAITGMTSGDGSGLHTFYNLHNSIMAYLTFPGEDEFLTRIDHSFTIEDEAQRQAAWDELTEEIINNFWMYNIFDVSYGYVYNVDVENFSIVAGRQLMVEDWVLNR